METTNTTLCIITAIESLIIVLLVVVAKRIIKQQRNLVDHWKNQDNNSRILLSRANNSWSKQVEDAKAKHERETRDANQKHNHQQNVLRNTIAKQAEHIATLDARIAQIRNNLDANGQQPTRTPHGAGTYLTEHQSAAQPYTKKPTKRTHHSPKKTKTTKFFDIP